MLPNDPEELFVNAEGDTWHRILVIDYRSQKELMRLRALDDKFKEHLISTIGRDVVFQYVGGNMDGTVFA